MHWIALDMEALFAQLGQASDPASITRFLEDNSPLPGNIRLHEAPCWTAWQAAFLREALLQDADWADAVEALNASLHH